MAFKSLLQTVLDDDLAIGGTSVDVTNDILFNQIINVSNADAVIRNRKGNLFEMVKVDIVNNVATFSKRGLTQAATFTEDPSLKRGWKKGDIMYITMLAPSIVGLDVANTWTASQTFSAGFTASGTSTMNALNLTSGVVSGSFIINGVVRVPIYADATARDAAITSPTNGMIIFNTAVGLYQKYQAGAWIDDTSGASVPNASTTVAGKVQIATASDLAASNGTGTTGAPTAISASSAVKTPSGSSDENKIPVMNPGGNVNQFVAGFGDYTYFAWETIAIGKPLFVENMDNFTNIATTTQNIGDINNNTKIAFSVIGTGTQGNSIKLALKKTGSPSVALSVRIETDNAGSPSGNLVHANATATVLAASLTTSLADTTVTFAGNFTPTSTTKYWVVLNQVGDLVDASNYYGVGYSTNTSTMNIYKKYFMGWAGSTATDIQTATVYNLTASETNPRGWRFTAKTTCEITGVSRISGSTVTHCYIKTAVGNTTLATSTTLVGDLFTFTPYTITAGTDYRIEFDSNGSNYTFHYRAAAVTSSLTNVAYVTGSLGGGDSEPGELLDIRTSVAAASSAVIMYQSSNMFHGNFLGLADSTYTYKYDLYGIAASAATVGTKPFVTLPLGGYDKNQSGLTTGSMYYLSNTPGVLSTTPGTNKMQVGRAVNSTTLLLSKRNLASFSINVGSSAFTYQNTTGQTIQVLVSGGTVSRIDYSKDNSTFDLLYNATGHFVTLYPLDYLKITHSSTPTMTGYYI